MDKILLVFAVISLGSAFYFFFFNISLLYGSISFILCVLFNIFYAMLSTTNKLPDDYDPETYGKIIKK